jgi:hypothetical protein
MDKSVWKIRNKWQKPFIAKKKNDSIWIVHGTFNKKGLGGVAYAEVNVKKQKIVTYTHGE